MLDKLKSFFKVWSFCYLALVDDYGRSRWYKNMSTTYVRLDKVVNLLLGGGLVSFAVYYFYSHSQLLLNNKRWVAIIVLSVIAAFLLFLIGSIKRFHERTVADLTDNLHERVGRLKELCEVYGGLHELLKQDRRDSHWPTIAALQYWAEQLRDALWACYGLAGTEKFTEGGNHYSVTVPEDESKHSEWLYNSYERLGDLIEEESPKQKPLPAHVPDSAFRS
jgi:hypothetical protein